MSKRLGESSATVHKRISAARELQVTRMKADGITSNSHMKASQLREDCDLDTTTAINYRGRIGIWWDNN